MGKEFIFVFELKKNRIVTRANLQSSSSCTAHTHLPHRPRSSAGHTQKHLKIFFSWLYVFILILFSFCAAKFQLFFFYNSSRTDKTLTFHCLFSFAIFISIHILRLFFHSLCHLSFIVLYIFLFLLIFYSCVSFLLLFCLFVSQSSLLVRFHWW